MFVTFITIIILGWYFYWFYKWVQVRRKRITKVSIFCFFHIKHEYLRSRASRCLSLSSSSSGSHRCPIFHIFGQFIEILVLVSWILHPRIFWKMIREKKKKKIAQLLWKAFFDSSSTIIISLPIEIWSNFYVNKLTSEIEKANQFL